MLFILENKERHKCDILKSTVKSTVRNRCKNSSIWLDFWLKLKTNGFSIETANSPKAS